MASNNDHHNGHGYNGGQWNRQPNQRIQKKPFSKQPNGFMRNQNNYNNNQNSNYQNKKNWTQNNYTNNSQDKHYHNNNNNNNNNGNKHNNNNSKKTCYRCHQKGHIASDCRVKTVNNATVQENQENVCESNSVRVVSDRMIFQSNVSEIVTMYGSSNVSHSIQCVEGTIDNKRFLFALDTGATASIMSYRAAVRRNLNILPSTVRIKSQNNQIDTVKGITEVLVVKIGNFACRMNFLITNTEDHEVLLGLDWFFKSKACLCPSEGMLKFQGEEISLNSYLGSNRTHTYINNVEEFLISEISDANDDENNEENIFPFEENNVIIETSSQLNENQRQIFMKLLSNYRDIFALGIKDLSGCKLGTHSIRTLDVPPIFQHPYRISHTEREYLKNEIKLLMDHGIIEPSDSAWSSPVILVPKSNGKKRLCIDYRKLNSVTISETFPVPLVLDILERLGDSDWFTTLDMASGYWQVLIEPGSKPKTAFSTPDGHFQFTRLPFGLKNAPVVFIRLMNKLFGNKPFVEVYFDDIIIHSKSFDQHVLDVRETLNLIHNSGLKLQGTKCKWFARRTKILGHIVSKSKIEMDEEKIEALKNRAAPKNIKQLQELLGICNYYRRFVENFAKIASPLTNLLKKDKQFLWGDEEEKAFRTLIEKLISFPILRQPDFNRGFIVICDASNSAIGAILAQKDDDRKEYVCAYASRLLKGAECHYGISEKECLAVLWAIKHFRIYIYGKRFTVVTDHSALTWLINIKEPTGRLARWSIYLQAFQFEVIYRKGTANANANAMSRPVLLGEIYDDDKDAYISAKTLDPYEDDNLIHYLRYRKHNMFHRRFACETN